MIYRVEMGRSGWARGTGSVVVAAVLLGMGTAPVGAQAVQGAAAGAVPIHNMAADADPVFEVATIKLSDPNASGQGFQISGRYVRVKNKTVNDMISWAYGIHEKQIVGGPAWFTTDRYEINGVPDVAGEPNVTQFRSMIRKVLADRFGLKIHSEKREMPVYALTVAKGGPKLTKSGNTANDLRNQTDDTNGMEMEFDNTSMADFALGIMQYVLDKPVIDQTGIKGKYNFKLKWTLDEIQASSEPNASPGLFTAIQEQLGLKLEAVKAPADVIVIDKVERPSAN